MTLELRNGGDQEVTLDIIAVPDEGMMSTEIGKKTLKTGESTEIRFVLSEYNPVGPVAASMTLQSSGRPETRISIPVTGTVVE